jgi:ABC-2 type transport system permease protein/oleandomycin transport system permease protein
MSATTTFPAVQRSPARTFGDIAVITRRNLLYTVRLPQVLVLSSIMPVIFILMFTYVFGGAIQVPGVDYVNFLMPGIFVQTVAFGATSTGVGLAEDLGKGLIERFRSLPMARSAVLAGRTVADLVRNVFVVALMCAVGFLVGFRPSTGVLAFLGGVVLLLLLGFALSWLFAIVGLGVRNAESAQAATFPLTVPLVFASSAFVPLESMPGWLQAWAERQPVTITVNAVRALMIGGPTSTYVMQSLAWSIGMVAVFAPIAVRRYRRTA